MAGNIPDSPCTICDIHFGLVGLVDDWLFQFDVPQIIPNSSDEHKTVIPAGGKAVSLETFQPNGISASADQSSLYRCSVSVTVTVYIARHFHPS